MIEHIGGESVETDHANVPKKMPPVALVAVIIAFLFAAGSLALAFVRIMYLPGGLLFAAAGWQMLRRRSWGGYGLTLMLVSQVLLLPLLVTSSAATPEQIVGSVLSILVFGPIFFLAGRALSKSGSPAGARWPWVMITLGLTVPFLFVRAFVVPTGSMENTLLIGDHLFVRTFPRSTPKRGDVIVFHYPIAPKDLSIKRVIGVANDRVQMKNRVVYVNGVALAEPYVIHRTAYDVTRDELPGDSDNPVFDSMPRIRAAREAMLREHVVDGAVVVPAGKYFVLGDNRDNSLDSRYWGFVDESAVIGKPILVYDSEEAEVGDLGSGVLTRTKMRWERVFKVL